MDAFIIVVDEGRDFSCEESGRFFIDEDGV